MPTTPTPPIPLHQVIINAACQYYNISEADLKTREHVEKKKIVLYLLRMECDMKYKDIAKLFDSTALGRAWEHVYEIDARKEISRSIRTDIQNLKLISGICE